MRSFLKNPPKKSFTGDIMFLGYDFKMLSDGKSLVFLDPNRDSTIVANKFFVKSISANTDYNLIDVSSINSEDRVYRCGMMNTILSFELTVDGPIEYKEGGIIRSIFDLYSIRDLLSQVEKKVTVRG